MACPSLLNIAFGFSPSAKSKVAQVAWRTVKVKLTALRAPPLIMKATAKLMRQFSDRPIQIGIFKEARQDLQLFFDAGNFCVRLLISGDIFPIVYFGSFDALFLQDFSNQEPMAIFPLGADAEKY